MNSRINANSESQILIAIVNYKTAELVERCLDSLSDEIAAIGGVEVIVSDNASGDDSVRTITEHIEERGFSGWCNVLKLKENGGFAYGNNACIRDALSRGRLPKYVLLLNSDTYIREGAINKLRAYMDANLAVGIAGSRLENPDGTPQRSAFRFHSVLSEIEQSLCLGPATHMLRRYVVAPSVSNEIVRTDWVAGASMMIRRDVFESVGLLDEGYFMYFEEVDFCLRAANANFSCVYVPESRVVHLVGQSSGVTSAERNRIPRYWYESRARYWLLNRGIISKFAADVFWIVGRGLCHVRFFLQRKPNPFPPHHWRDFVKFNFFTRAAWTIEKR